MTRQAEWQRRKVAEGLCRQCGKRPLRTGQTCSVCSAKANARTRKYVDKLRRAMKESA